MMHISLHSPFASTYDILFKYAYTSQVHRCIAMHLHHIVRHTVLYRNGKVCLSAELIDARYAARLVGV